MTMSKKPTLPTFGEIVPGEGGRLGAIMRGNIVGGVRQADYAIIVPDLPAIELPWGEYGKQIAGADSLTDGLANTAAMLKANCPPALHITGLVADGHRDLYLGARGEMWALRANVPELFDKKLHWTSTQYDSNYAFVQVFENGFSGWYLKDHKFLCRPLRRIQLQHFPA
jgi:hypothetical protein